MSIYSHLLPREAVNLKYLTKNTKCVVCWGGFQRYPINAASHLDKPLAKVLMQGFLTTDGHEIYTDGFDSLDRLLQEVYYLLTATVIGKTRPYKDSPTV